MEEVGRIIGYAAIAPEAPSLEVGVLPANPKRPFLRWARAGMAAQGFTEFYNTTFVVGEAVGECGQRANFNADVRLLESG